MKTIAKNNDQINVKLYNNSENLDEFQNLVFTLNKMVSCLEIKVSKHETNILECKNKVTQITTDYIKKDELNHLLKQQPTITSNGLPDMEKTSG